MPGGSRVRLHLWTGRARDPRTRVPRVTDKATDRPLTTSDAGAQLEEIRAGYAFEGPALDLGAVVVDGTGPPGRAGAHPARRPSTATASSPARRAPARPRPSSSWPSSSRPRACPSSSPTSRATCPGWRAPGEANDKITAARDRTSGSSGAPRHTRRSSCPSAGSGTGIPIRASVTSFGPTLLAKVLGLNETQESSLGLVFHYADKNGLALLDIKDLRAVISHLTSDEGKADLKALGGLSSATAGVILRELITFSDQGADVFFGEPEFDTERPAAHRRGRPGLWSTCSSCRRCRTGPSCSRRSSCGCSPTCSTTCPRSATSTSPSWCSSSTRRTCSSTTRARTSSTRSSRPCGSSGPRASASSS